MEDHLKILCRSAALLRVVRGAALAAAIAWLASAGICAEGRARAEGRTRAAKSPNEIGKDDRTALTRAIVEDASAEEVRAILDAGADPNAADGTGYPPLWLALYRGNKALAGLLLSAGADPNLPYHDGDRVLDEYLRYSGHDAETLGMLLEAGADPNARARSGRTPLAIALQFEVPPAMTLRLLEAGADPASVNDDGADAWHFLARNRDYSESDLDAIFALMARNGAEGMLLSDGNGKSALLIACERGGGRLATRFMAAGKALGEPGISWIRSAYPSCIRALVPARDSYRDIDAAGLIAIIGAFLECGVSVSTPVAEDGADALLMIAGHPALHECASWLLDRGALPSPPGPEGTALLMKAVEADNAALARRLAGKAVDPNAPGPDGSFPLEAARSAECAKALADGGADLRFRDSRGRGLLEIACQNRSAPALVSYCLDAGLAPAEGAERRAILEGALRAGEAAKALVLIDRGFDPRFRFPDGKNALHAYVAMHGRRLSSEGGATEDDLALVKRLIALGLSPEEPDSSGETAYASFANSGGYGAAIKRALYDGLGEGTRAAIDAEKRARDEKLAQEERANRIGRAALAAGLPLAYLGACIASREGFFAENRTDDPLAVVNGVLSLGAGGFLATGIAALALTLPLAIGGSGSGAAWAGIGVSMLSIAAGGVGAIGSAFLLAIPEVRAAFSESGFLYYLVPALASATGIGISIAILVD